jgi:ElaB/YqjD/DUF883 family membrane-anchored ribosome-binding protein
MNTTTANPEKLAGDLKNVVQESEQLLAAMAGEKAEAIREQLGELVESARDCCSKLEAKAKAGLESADHSVREHPYQAIGIAAAVGVIVGVLISRK